MNNPKKDVCIVGGGMGSLSAAIYLNKKGKIFDPQQGINDLKNNIVKFIGDPQTRIEEDFLRILRFLRFSIQYNEFVNFH